MQRVAVGGWGGGVGDGKGGRGVQECEGVREISLNELVVENVAVGDGVEGRGEEGGGQISNRAFAMDKVGGGGEGKGGKGMEKRGQINFLHEWAYYGVACWEWGRRGCGGGVGGWRVGIFIDTRAVDSGVGRCPHY